MVTIKTDPSALSEENRKVVVSLIIGYDLLHHQDIKTTFYSALSQHTQQSNIKLTRGCWDIVLLLCEAHLTNAKNVVTDMCAMSTLSESTTRRALRKLQTLEIVERFNDTSDRRRHYVRLTTPYSQVVDQFVNKCARDFRDLIELNDKRERMRVVEAWLEAETRLQLMVDAVPALISYVDDKQHYVFNNQRYLEWFGYQNNSLTGKHMREVLGNGIYKLLFPHIKTVLAGEKVSFELEIPYPTEHNSRFVVANYIPDISNEGKVNGFISHIIDITEQKKNEENIEKNDLRFQLVTETISDVFWMSTCGVTEMLYVSPAYETIWQRSCESLYERPESFLDAILAADREAYLATLKRYHSQAKAYECEYRITQHDGAIRWIHEKGYPVLKKRGNKQLMSGICTDITEQKIVQQAPELRVTRSHFDDITEGTGVGIWEWNIAAHMVNFNRSMALILGYSSEEVGCISMNTWSTLMTAKSIRNY